MLVAPARELGPGPGEIQADRVSRLARERHDSVLPPFAVAHEERPRRKIDIREVEPHALAHPQPRAVEQLQDRASARGRQALAGKVEKGLHLDLFQVARDVLLRARRQEGPGGVPL